MGFPPDVKEEALIRAARRCCVCWRYKGVGVEVHHIIPEADGGPSDFGNAIVLCFDCHCAAGHYNLRHPRGTKYSPRELKRHRESWYQSVKKAGIQPLDDGEFSGYYARHLICVDRQAARNLLLSNKSEVPFRYDYIMENNVFGFMLEILEDDLPFAWADSKNLIGHYWGSGNYESIDDFYNQHPEFERRSTRPLDAKDVVKGGLVPSNTMRKIVDSGFPPSELGNVCVEEHGCGGSITYFVAMRRPLFVFAELRNIFSERYSLCGLIARIDQSQRFVHNFHDWIEGELNEVSATTLTLEPGEVLLIPECMLLSSRNHDPINLEFEDAEEISREEVQAVGLRTSTMEDDFYWFGPAVKLQGFDLEVGHDTKRVPIHSFNPSKCYVYYRAWLVGSCPHVYLFDEQNGWGYLCEILSHGDDETFSFDWIFIPKNVSRVRVVEIDFEVSLIDDVIFNGKQIVEEPVRLERGDVIDLEVCGPGILVVVGKYRAPIRSPRCYLQLRQKLSLRSAYELEGLG